MIPFALQQFLDETIFVDAKDDFCTAVSKVALARVQIQARQRCVKKTVFQINSLAHALARGFQTTASAHYHMASFFVFRVQLLQS